MIPLTLVSSAAFAQGAAESFLHDGADDHAVRVTVEMDPAMAFGLGYVRAVDLRSARFTRRLGVHLDTTAILGLSSWDVVGGVTAPLGDGAGLDLLATTDLEVKRVHNDVHTGLTYGYGLALRPGFYGGRGYVGADLAVHGTFAATVNHSDAYRAQFPDVVDGTYTTGRGSGFVGAAAGVCVARTVLVGARLAWRIPGSLESYAPWFQPYTVNLDVGARFGGVRAR